MAELKTQKTEASVEDFLNKIKDEEIRRDCFEIAKIMKQVTRSANEFICDHNPLFACAMLKQAVAGINVSFAVRVDMAALNMSGSFRTAR